MAAGCWRAKWPTVSAMTRPDRPRRHDWVWLAQGWQRHLGSKLSPEHGARVAAWVAACHPFVVAGHASCDSEQDVRLGLSAPDKTRLGIHIARGAIMRSSPAPTLDDVAASIPAAWQGSLRAAHGMAREAGLAVRVYGSLAWSHWSGLPFVRPGSDVDLLLQISRSVRLPDLYDFLGHLAGLPSTPRLDGEIILPGGLAVAWREVAGRPDDILVKGGGAPRLVARRDWDRMVEEVAA